MRTGPLPGRSVGRPSASGGESWPRHVWEGRSAWKVPPLWQWKAPVLSTVDVLTDVWTARRFFEIDARNGDAPVFGTMSLCILASSACMGSALFLLIQRVPLLAGIYEHGRKCGRTLSPAISSCGLAALFVPISICGLFFCLCPFGHLLPVALWALSTWRSPSQAPSLDMLHLQRAQRFEEEDDAVRLQLTVSSVGRSQTGESASGAYDDYADAYRNHLRNVLAVGLQPTPPSQPKLEDFAETNLSDQNAAVAVLSAEIANAEVECGRVQGQYERTRLRAQQEWLGVIRDGFVHDRFLRVKENVKRALRSAEMDLSAAAFTCSELQEFRVGFDWGQLLETLGEAEMHRMQRMSRGVRSDRRTDVRRCFLERDDESLSVFSLNQCKALASRSTWSLDHYSAQLSAQLRAEVERAELNTMWLRLQTPATNAEATTHANTRAQGEPEVMRCSSQLNSAKERVERLRQRLRDERSLLEQQADRQIRMKRDFKHAVEVTYLVLDADFFRAQFEHQVMAEAGFIVETVLESVPQALLQLTAIQIYAHRGIPVAGSACASVMVSVTSVMSKVFVFCRSHIKHVMAFKITIVCMDTLVLFYIAQVLWSCRPSQGDLCYGVPLLNRGVDRLAHIWLCAHAFWWILSLASSLVVPLLLWAACVSRVNQGRGTVLMPRNPLRRAALWLFAHAREPEATTFGSSAILVVAVASLPFFLLIGTVAAIIVPPLVVVTIATFRVSCLVLWLNELEASLFEGPSKALYLTAFQFVASQRSRINRERRLDASRAFIASLAEHDHEDGAGHDMPRGASNSNWCCRCVGGGVTVFKGVARTIWNMLVPNVSLVLDTLSVRQGSLINESQGEHNTSVAHGDDGCLGIARIICFPLVCGLVGTAILSFLYIVASSASEVRRWSNGRGATIALHALALREPRMVDPDNAAEALHALTLAGIAICITIAASLFCCSPLGSLVRFMVCVPRPPDSVVDFPGGETGIQEQFLAVMEETFHDEGDLLDVHRSSASRVYTTIGSATATSNGYVPMQ